MTTSLLVLRVRCRLGIMALWRRSRGFPEFLDVVNVGYVGFDIETASRNVVWIEIFLAHYRVEDCCP